MIRQRLAYVLKVVLIFAVVGPLIGLLVFATGLSILAMLNAKPEGVWIAPFLMLYGVVFAHFVGLPWALIAGAAASGLSIWLESSRRRLWIGPASGAISLLVAWQTGSITPQLDPSAPQVPVDSFTSSFALVMALAHLFAASGCWALASCLKTPTPTTIAPG